MTLMAQCPCGETLRVDEPERGQTLYGTLADKMATHEPRCGVIASAQQWTFDHPHDVDDIDTEDWI